MHALCKTNKGTLSAMTYGNTWYDDNEKQRGISFGILNYPTIGLLHYDGDNDKLTLTINKANAKKLGIEVIMR